MLTVYDDKNENTRIGNIGFFLQLAVDNYIQAKAEFHEAREEQLRHSIIIPTNPNSWPDIEYLLRRQDGYFKYTIQGIINLAIFYEAFINEVGMISLGSGYFKEHLDRLPILSKWELVLRLLFTRKIDFSQFCFQQMATVISTRNSLVHYKTKIADPSNVWPLWGSTLEAGIKATIPLKEYLMELDPENEHLPMREFITEILLLSDSLPDLKLS